MWSAAVLAELATHAPPRAVALTTADLAPASLSTRFAVRVQAIKIDHTDGRATAITPAQVGAWVRKANEVYRTIDVELLFIERYGAWVLLEPEADRLGAGWNIIQSKTAIGSGGWTGKGWLQGTQSHLDFLPESQTDFIIAVLAEEFGLRGVLLLLLVYGLIVFRGFMISAAAQSTFGRLLSAALTLTFFVYIFVNMGMVAGILPVVGVPLPLVSFGGTSIVSLMLGFGILTAISTEKRMISQ